MKSVGVDENVETNYDENGEALEGWRVRGAMRSKGARGDAHDG